MEKVHIITIFDKNYLGRAVCMRESLAKFAPEITVYFLCLDQESYDMIEALHIKNTRALTPEDLNDKELLESRKTRTNPEFASTCKPAFLKYMIDSGIVGKEDLLVFIDPDFLFYQSPAQLFEDVYHNGSITTTPHRFPKHKEQEHLIKGVFNAGIVFFKNDSFAYACLSEWRKQCIDWCYLRYEDGKIGDQGYMSNWPQKYKNVYVLAHKGVNLSTWNIENYTISEKEQGQFLVDDDPLICYHFHGLRLYFDSKNSVRIAPITNHHKKIYEMYEKAINKTYEHIQMIDPTWQWGTISNPGFLKIIKQRLVKRFL